MSVATEVDHLRSTVRSSLMIGGLVSIVVGAVILVWPTKSAMAVAAVFGVYTVIAGLAYIGVGLASSVKTGWARIGNILLGVLFIIAGFVLFTNLQATTAALLILVTVMVGVVWIVEGVTAFTTIGHGGSKVWAILYGVISIIAGIILLVSPLASGALLWLILGVSAVVLGIVQVIRAFSI